MEFLSNNILNERLSKINYILIKLKFVIDLIYEKKKEKFLNYDIIKKNKIMNNYKAEIKDQEMQIKIVSKKS